MDWLRRWTGFYLLDPHRYLDPAAIDEAFDLLTWSREEYGWSRDPWLGLQDHVQPVRETLETDTGDCVDYSAVVLSVLLAEGVAEATLMLCRTGALGHLAVAADGRTFSSGAIVEESPADYYDRTRFTRLFHRNVTLNPGE